MSSYKYAVKVLEQLKNPLPTIYADVNEFLWDFWPDMPWSPAEGALVASEILSNEDLRHIVRAFDVRHNLEGDASIEIGMMVTAMENFDEQS